MAPLFILFRGTRSGVRGLPHPEGSSGSNKSLQRESRSKYDRCAEDPQNVGVCAAGHVQQDLRRNARAATESQGVNWGAPRLHRASHRAQIRPRNRAYVGGRQ